ncbi:MAG: transcriptional regulator NrdR [Chloroflexota bacterium]|nr:transcriptional regulator NrdR [Chloroflexota bacterium]
MNCPFCSHPESRVIDSRDSSDAIRRRRQCLRCGSRFSTYERLHAAALMVLKKDGRREEFSRAKLLAGITTACAKRPVSQEAIENIVDDIEAGISRMGRGEVATATIGDLVMERLRQLDGIAYIRFASVYRAFTDVDEVREAADAYARLRPQGDAAAQLSLFPNGTRTTPPGGDGDGPQREAAPRQKVRGR